MIGRYLLIETYHDGYGWCAFLGGDYLGRWLTEGEAFGFAYGEKCRLQGVTI